MAREKRSGEDLGPTGRKWYNSDFVRLIIILVSSGVVGGTTSLVSNGAQGNLLPLENQYAIEALESDLEHFIESNNALKNLEYQILVGKIDQVKISIDVLRESTVEIKESIKRIKSSNIGGKYEENFNSYATADTSLSGITER